MKKNKAIFLTATLAITMILQGNNLINAEEIQDWAKPGLDHAVNSHIIEGDKNGNINPEGELTRAELATMVNRILGLSERADLSNYQDVDSSKWYYQDLSKVVKAGIFKGDGKNLRPEDTITREEVFTIVSRVYDIEGLDTAKKNFQDSNEISSWAKTSVFGLVDKGFVNGNELDKLNPKARMTRAEFASLFKNISPKVISEAGNYKGEKIEGNLLINSKNVNLDGIEIEGDLILAEGMGLSDISLNNVIVKGKILTRGGGNIKLEGKSQVNEIRVLDSVKEIKISLDKETKVEVIQTEAKLNLEGQGKLDKLLLNKGSSNSIIKVENVKIEKDAEVKNIKDESKKDTKLETKKETKKDDSKNTSSGGGGGGYYPNDNTNDNNNDNNNSNNGGGTVDPGQPEVTKIEVETIEELRAALENEKIKEIILTKNIKVDESISITRPVILEGKNEDIKITGPSDNTLPNDRQHGIVVYSSDVTIKNLTVDSSAGYNIQVYGVSHAPENILIDNVLLKNAQKGGLLINGGKVKVDSLSLRDNAWGGIEVASMKDNPDNILYSELTGSIKEFNPKNDKPMVWIDGEKIDETVAEAEKNQIKIYFEGKELKAVDKVIAPNNKDQIWYEVVLDDNLPNEGENQENNQENNQDNNQEENNKKEDINQNIDENIINDTEGNKRENQEMVSPEIISEEKEEIR